MACCILGAKVYFTSSELPKWDFEIYFSGWKHYSPGPSRGKVCAWNQMTAVHRWSGDVIQFLTQIVLWICNNGRTSIELHTCAIIWGGPRLYWNLPEHYQPPFATAMHLQPHSKSQGQEAWPEWKNALLDNGKRCVFFFFFLISIDSLMVERKKMCVYTHYYVWTH